MKEIDNREKPMMLGQEFSRVICGNEKGSPSQNQSATSKHEISTSSSDVPAGPTNLSVGGKASLQPKRTPVSDKEIEAILLGGCF